MIVSGTLTTQAFPVPKWRRERFGLTLKGDPTQSGFPKGRLIGGATPPSSSSMNRGCASTTRRDWSATKSPEQETPQHSACRYTNEKELVIQ
jgi:hypothetical protein